MHPILSDKKRLFVYLIVWGVLGTLTGFIISMLNGLMLMYSLSFTLPLMLVFGEVNLSAWYLCRAFPLERNSPWKILLVSMLSVVIISCLWTLLSWGWLNILEQTFGVSLAPLPLLQLFFIIFGVGIQLFLISLALGYLISTLERSKELDREAFEARLLAQNAELKALRMQINPHFLFNSLNSINALITTNTGLARSMTTTLADFFRKSLSYGARETISLQEELSLLKHYLDIEKIRFGKRLTVVQNIEQETLSDQVPPLLLQPLVENAIKHGISNSIDGGTISISTLKKQGRLFITIENPMDKDAPPMKGTGMGLKIVQKRLTTLYGNNGDVKMTVNGNTFQVIVFLPGQSNQ